MAVPVLLAAGTFANISASNQQAEAQQQAASYNASVGQQNARLALAQGAEEERRSRIQSGKVLGSQRANRAASGIQLEGSALDVLQESATNAELDALTVRHNSQLKAWQYEAGVQKDLLAGENASKAGGLGATAALLGGGARIGEYYSKR